MNNTESRQYIQYAVAVVIGFIVGAGIIAIYNSSTGNVTRSDSATTTTEGKTVASSDTTTSMPLALETQSPGSRVVVSHVAFPKVGWVVVHEILDGKVGNALGATMRDSGPSDNVEVILLRPMKASGNYAIGLYTDNGNHIFERRIDTPIGGANGDPELTPIVFSK